MSTLTQFVSEHLTKHLRKKEIRTDVPYRTADSDDPWPLPSGLGSGLSRRRGRCVPRLTEIPVSGHRERRQVEERTHELGTEKKKERGTF